MATQLASADVAGPDAAVPVTAQAGDTLSPGLGRRLLHRPLFLLGAATTLAWVIAALLHSVIGPYNPDTTNPLNTFARPGAAHLFGTDELGRDVLSRVLAGAASVLEVAPAATLLAIILGTGVGLLAGYARGLLDEAVMRVMDAVMAFPIIIAAAVVIGALGPSTLTLIVVVGLVFTPIVARTVRAAVSLESEREYVEAARLRGEGPTYVALTEILPNITGPLLVEATARLGAAVFASASLSFLGLGVQPPTPDWGLAIATDYIYLPTAWWTALFPALALSTLVIGVGLVAEAIGEEISR